MAARTLPPLELLRECFDYDPSTGVLTWKVRPAHHFARKGNRALWNGRYAGTTPNCISHRGYIHVSLYRQYMAHRLIWKLVTGNDPTGHIDHINGNGLDNSWSNLREATRSENLCNTGARRKNKFGLKGVSGPYESGRFSAQIAHKGKKIRLGYFDTPEEAHAAYCKAAKELHGEFANFGSKAF